MPVHPQEENGHLEGAILGHFQIKCHNSLHFWKTVKHPGRPQQSIKRVNSQVAFFATAIHETTADSNMATDAILGVGGGG
jgi:hypothetical protein